MSSNKRARTRAIRAEMATSGESYSRAARAATTRAARDLRRCASPVAKTSPMATG